jgi:DNA-binding transcriptional regulator YhcF (GntR family)
MKIRLDRTREESLLDQARSQIIAALHAGIVQPGDRLPSLRRVAIASGLNVKTVMRVYALLQEERLVALRGGSGAFLAENLPRGSEPLEALKLFRLVHRHFNDASALKLSPALYASIVQRVVTRSAILDKSVAVLECNEEQVRLYSREIEARIGVHSIPVRLSDCLRGGALESLRSASILAVTDFHLNEGTLIARQLRKPLVRLHLRDDFLPTLIDAARSGRLLMIVHDPSFFPAFKRALGQLGLQREHVDRIQVVAGLDPADARRAMARADAVYISPLCAYSLRDLAPRGIRFLDFINHIATETLEELEAWLLLSDDTLPGKHLPPS